MPATSGVSAPMLLKDNVVQPNPDSGQLTLRAGLCRRRRGCPSG